MPIWTISLLLRISSAVIVSRPTLTKKCLVVLGRGIQPRQRPDAGRTSTSRDRDPSFQRFTAKYAGCVVSRRARPHSLYKQV